MSGVQTSAVTLGVAGVLPFEGQSSSELLAASHLFTIEVLAVSAGPWARGADGLEHRGQTIEMRVLERFKGELDVKPGERFTIETEQHREADLGVSDYHGFWSHAEVSLGGRYLVVSRGVEKNTNLFQEPSIRALFPEAPAADDVRAAIAAEQDIAADRAGGRSLTGAIRQLVQQTHAGRGRLRGLFGEYAWARIAPGYEPDQGHLFPLLVGVFADRETTLELRQPLIDGMYEATTAVGPNPARELELVRPLLGLLLQPEAAPLVEYLVQDPIYNLVFHQDKAVASAATVVPDARDRAAMRAALSRQLSERAGELAAWLGR